ncbi:MAG: hypothetical protein R2932_48515 [Caldilineaceae bacterium]
MQADIARLRRRGLVRANTTGLAFQDANPFAISIEGPETLELQEAGYWKIAGSLVGTLDVSYRYRLHDARGWGSWHDVSALDV